MKIANNCSPLIVSDGLDPNVSVMGMTPAAALRMTQHLSETVYNDKQLAVVRESLTNANDEHIKFKVDRPVETGIRQNDNQYEFFARDYAEGLDEAGVREVFAMYGESLKNHTNDLAGGFGIGTGALVSYNNSAIITSHYKGEKKVYSLVRGANEEGFLVGHCYLIHTEPTEETGIEVCVPIKNEDLAKFSEEITKFVQLSPHKIVGNILSQEVLPAESSFSKEIEGISIKSLKNARTNHSNNALAVLQMGGVSYSTIDLPEGFKCLDGEAVIVNIPVGSMTIPLSRESFHDTPSNQNFLNKIKTILKTLADEDFAVFRAKPLKETINENLGELYNSKYLKGQIFQAKISSVWPDVWPLVNTMRKTGAEAPFVQKDKKEVLVLVPDNSATDYWNSKLRDFARTSGVCYYVACEKMFSKLNPEGERQLKEIFSTVSVKKLPYPKGKKSKAMAVYRRGRKVGDFTAIGLVNHIREVVYKLPEERDEVKLKEWIQEAIKNIQNQDQLKQLSITDGGKNDRALYWQCNSSALVKEFQDLGLFKFCDSNYQKFTTTWESKRKEAQNRECAINNALRSWISNTERTKTIVKAKPESAERLAAVWESLLKEKSTRGKVLEALEYKSGRSYYSSSSNVILTRAELRSILKLQNA